ncbi:hypothetical protein ACO1O0_001948 [Amphichorda felina]
MSGASRPTTYPRCCFHLSPTYNVWCLLRAADIQHLQQHSGQDFFFYKNLPIRWTRIVGIVVAIDDFAGRRVFTIDDSSGVCIKTITTYTPPPEPQNAAGASKDLAARVKATGQSHDQPAKDVSDKQPVHKQQSLPYEEIDVGAVVDVKGKLTTFRNEVQIKIEKMVCLKSTAQEVTLWEKRARFRRDVLDPPWVLRDKDVRRCRKEAERSEEETERKRRRIKAAVERAAASRNAEKPMEPPKRVRKLRSSDM